MNSKPAAKLPVKDSLTRQDFLAAATLGAAATLVSSGAVGQEASIQRLRAPPGLRASRLNGQDIYSHVVVTTRQRTLYIAGQLARDINGNVVGKGDIRAQVRQVFENMKAALAAAGATLDDVVQTQTFVTDWSEYRKAVDIHQEYLKALPTSTAVQVTRLSLPEYMVEVNAIAVLEG